MRLVCETVNEGSVSVRHPSQRPTSETTPLDLMKARSLSPSVDLFSVGRTSSSLVSRRVVCCVYIQSSGIFLEVTKASWMNSVFERGGWIASEKHLQ